MALRICLVTPFAWSQPHDVNEHVAGIARELRALGHAVTIIASSNRASELAAGRIDAKAALDRVIDRVIDRQIGPGAPAAVREKVRAALESAVADDPLLSEKIKALGAG